MRSGGAAAAGVGEVGAQGGPRVDRRVGVAEIPLVSGEAPVGVHIPLLEQELELVFGQRGVGKGEWNGVEGEVPAGEPRVFPIVGHGDDIMRDEVAPLGVARVGAERWRESGVAVEPFAHVVMVEHFVPFEPGEGLLLDLSLRGSEVRGCEGLVVVEALAGTGGHHLAGIHFVRGAGRAKSHLQGGRGARGEVEAVNGGGFGAHLRGVDRLLFPVDEVAVEGVLGEGQGVRCPEEQSVVRFVFGKKDFPGNWSFQQPFAERLVPGGEERGG